MDEVEVDGIKSPIRRLGSTRKVLVSNNVRLQLNEQLRCLDVRMEAQVALIAELQDFFRKRAELEFDYSKSLEKMSKSIQLRHKEQKQKREHWPLFSSYACWQQLINETKSLSRDHAALSEVYGTHLVGRLNQVAEDVQRIYKRCREIGYETHEEILRVLHELHTTMKTYQTYKAESRQAETKLRVVEQQRTKLEVTNVPIEKLARSKKYKLIEKEVNKRKNKYTEAKLKALKARNEYILCLEASNTTIHKYFVEDLSDLIDCMDFGFHNCIARALLMHSSAEEGRQRSSQCSAEQLSSCISSLDSRADKQRFLEAHHAAFMIPKKLEFQGHRGDEPPEPELQKMLHSEMEQRLGQLQQRVTTLRTESEEVWKTLETAEASLREMLTAKDYDCSGYFGDNAVPTSKPPETLQIKLRADRQETEEFYLTKFREYLLGTSRIARLDAKQEYIRQIILDGSNASPNLSIGTVKQKQTRRKRIGRLQMNGQPKLFGGSLEEYLESTNQEIPLIIKSCVRVINLYGLHHQGIFRVSGSQVEINNFREWFERGEDPLADVTDASDINSVAGVLKLYLRELREPLFPIIYFEHLMELAQLESKQEFVMKMKELITSLPKTVVIVMRYLFAFLNHLSEFSDENMMDPYNLAICFGPTLVPVPEDKDQVQYQNQVNELIKNIITYNEEIFPEEIGGMQYEKYISREPDDGDVGDSPSDQVQEDMDSEVYPSEDESENMEATAQFDFIARSDRELSFKKGDSLTLFTQVSNDWWRGALAGREGLIPDKYIMLKIKDEDRDKDLLKSSSEESMRRQACSSADSVMSSNNSLLMGTANDATVWSSITKDSTAIQSESTTAVVSTVVKSVPCVSSTQPIISREDISTNFTRVTEIGPETDSSFAHENQANDQETRSNMDNLGQVAEQMNIKAQKNGSIRDKANSEGHPKSNSSLAKKQSWDSLRMEETVAQETTSNHSTSDDTHATFTANRELWQKRATSQCNLFTITTPKLFCKSQEYRELRLKHTPDLVMDLPLAVQNANINSVSSHSLSSSEENSVSVSRTEAAASPSGLESPDMSTAAERFAKQDQCTLKKNTKPNSTDCTGLDKKTKRSETYPDSNECPEIEMVRSASTNQIGDVSVNLCSPVLTRSTPKIVAQFADMHLTECSQQDSSLMQISAKTKPPSIIRKPVHPYTVHALPNVSLEFPCRIEKQSQNAEQNN